MRDFHYRWQFDLKSSPEELWPLVTDTNRFNRDTGVPSIEWPGRNILKNGRRLLRLSVLGMPIEWEEQPFEWVRPSRFGVVRRYRKGPINELRVQVELQNVIVTDRQNSSAGLVEAAEAPNTPASANTSPGNAQPEAQTRLIYEVWAKPKNVIGLMAIPIQIGLLSADRFARTLRDYDQLAQQGRTEANVVPNTEFVPGGKARLLAVSERLNREGCNERLTALLADYIEQTDDYALSRIRPYELADEWDAGRREVLELCLLATRAGALDLQWNLICPMCRGGEAADSLRDVSSQVHCDGCKIDFKVNFEQSVELTFRPNPSIRIIEAETFCIGGPQVTPHVLVQQLLPSQTRRDVNLKLNDGRYRLRTLNLAGWQPLRVNGEGASELSLRATTDGWADRELEIGRSPHLTFENVTNEEQLFILERTQWNDTAATAAEVTALQMFRDLFASEALRPGEQISVGTLTVLFTDLKNSTQLYREIGDATAFGRVMNHFDVLRETIADQNGALVKTIGDAVMAVFRQPAAALRAIFEAQQRLAFPPDGMLPLTLKAGLHTGPCIAVTLNDRLDYFGSTVNLAARLEGQSTGSDIVISHAVYADPEVAELIRDPDNGFVVNRFEIPLKGFAGETFELWRIGLQNPASRASTGATVS